MVDGQVWVAAQPFVRQAIRAPAIACGDFRGLQSIPWLVGALFDVTRWVCGTLVGPMMTNVCLLDQGKEQNKTSSRVQVLNCRQDGISVYRKGFNMNWTHTAWKDTLWYCVVLDENTTCDTGASRIPTGHLGDFSRNILVSSSSWTVHDPWTSMRLQDDAGGESCGCNML